MDRDTTFAVNRQVYLCVLEPCEHTARQPGEFGVAILLFCAFSIFFNCF